MCDPKDDDEHFLFLFTPPDDLAEANGGCGGDAGNALVMAVDAEALAGDEAATALVLGTAAAGGRRLWA